MTADFASKLSARRKLRSNFAKELDILEVTVKGEELGKLYPASNVLAKVTGKWQTLSAPALEDRALRFGEPKRTIDNIS